MRRSLQYTGVAAVVVIWTTLLAATFLAGFDLLGDEPLSYLGTRSRSAVLFTFGLAVPAVLLTAFHQDVRRRYPVSSGFSLAMLVGLAGQMVAAFVPSAGNLRFTASTPPARWCSARRCRCSCGVSRPVSPGAHGDG